MTRLAWLVPLIVALIPGGGVQAADTFNESDDYEEGEEIVGTFLQEPEYKLMIADITRNGQTFDWGWVMTEAMRQEPLPEPQGQTKRLLGKLRRTSTLTERPGTLGFELSTYKTVTVPNIKNRLNAGFIQ